MTEWENRLVRCLEWIGSMGVLLSVAALVCVIVGSLLSTTQAHDSRQTENRVAENRYICYTPDELIDVIEILHHSREIWRPADRALMTHDLISIYRICEERK